MGNSKWTFSQQEKDQLIEALSAELAVLRSKAGISQEELSELIGVSRQTYGAIERGTRKMSWSTFLSLIMFYDYNKKTHDMLRSIHAIPQILMKRINAWNEELDLGAFLGDGAETIINSLDDQALMSIKTMILLEYARCTATPGEIVIKSFDGMKLSAPKTVDQVNALKSMKAIRERNREYDKP